MAPDDIKALRRELRLTARRLAERLGVDEKLVFDWEKGEQFPTKRHCEAMQALCTPVAATAPAPASTASPLERLADPDLWLIVQKLAASSEFFEAVRALAAKVPDPSDPPKARSRN